MKACDPEGPVMINIAKLYHTADAQSFRAFGRVLSGTVKKGMEIKVFGEGYSPEDEEDMTTAIVDDIWICESRLVLFTSSLCSAKTYEVLTKIPDPCRRSISRQPRPPRRRRLLHHQNRHPCRPLNHRRPPHL